MDSYRLRFGKLRETSRLYGYGKVPARQFLCGRGSNVWLVDGIAGRCYRFIEDLAEASAELGRQESSGDRVIEDVGREGRPVVEHEL